MLESTHTNPFTRPGRRLLLALLAGLSLLTLMFAAGGRPAGAAALLIASENPVIIPAPLTTKPVTLSWDLNYAAPKATLTVQQNGGPVLFTGPAAATGSKPFAAVFGKSYTAKLANSAGTLATLTITTARPNPQTPPPPVCDWPVCITNVTVLSHGTWANFDVTTGTPATLRIEAGLQPPDGSGVFTSVVASASVPSLGKHSLVPLQNLKPDTQYFYAVTATDAASAKGVRTGSFKTLKRQYKVDFDKILLVDDSDDAGDCECWFNFFASGNGPIGYGDLDFATGEERDPNVQFTFTSSSLTLTVNGHDDDESCEFNTCICGTNFAPVGTGENYCGEWSETTQTILSVTMGSGEDQSGTFILIADGGNNSNLRYQVYGTYQITYVP